MADDSSRAHPDERRARDTSRQRRDRLARWDPLLGAALPISLGGVLAAIGVSGDDATLTGLGIALAVVGAPIGLLLGRRSRRRS